MLVEVNEKSREVEQASSLNNLLKELNLLEKFGIAVAINDTVIGKDDWATHTLQENDKILVITATQGG